MSWVYVFEFPNGKRYVGGTLDCNVKNRWGGGCNYSGCKVGKVIKDVGWSNINKYYWEVPDSQLDEIERFLIQLYKSNEPEYGYNSQSGGKKGFTQSVGNDTRQKISNARKGKQQSEETRRKNSESTKLWWARKRAQKIETEVVETPQV